MSFTSSKYIYNFFLKFYDKAVGKCLNTGKVPFVCALLITLAAGLSSCSNQISVQERLVTIPKLAWAHGYQPWVHIDIEDTTQAYRIYAVIRHNQQFKYDNLLLRYGYIAPGDSVVYHEVNLPLAKEDKWLGDTLGTIIETRISLGTTAKKLPKGDNVFVMGHLMPDEPLVGLLQVGIRIEATDSQPAGDASSSVAEVPEGKSEPAVDSPAAGSAVHPAKRVTPLPDAKK